VSPRSSTADPLDGVRPGGWRSFWLREALAEGPEALAAGNAAPPFSGQAAVDVAIIGGGYTLRGLGAGLFRAAMVRREAAEEASRRPPRLVAAVSRIPRRLGYHLGPE
jgi:hypothetical protein